MKRLIGTLMAAGLVAALVAPASASAPKTVWEDATGDADAAQGLGQSIPGGFDIVEGRIARDKKNLVFSVVHADMPASGSLPEGFRFLWTFSVDGSPFRITIKSADVGKPDVVGGQTSERVGRVDAQGHFRVEGECVTDASLPLQRVNCPVVGYYEGAFDAENASMSITIPMKDIGAKTKSKITDGGEQICHVCWVTHAAERSLNTTIIDSTIMATTYVVPKK